MVAIIRSCLGDLPISQTPRIVLFTISQFHNVAQYVQAVCLSGHTSCKHGGMYCLKCIRIEIFLSYFKNISTLHDVLPAAKQTAGTYCV